MDIIQNIHTHFIFYCFQTKDVEKEDKKENLFPPIANGSPSNSSVVKLDVSDSSIKPHGTYLTREKTEFDPVYAKRQKRDTQFRKAHLQLDLLRRGDIFVSCLFSRITGDL